GAAPAHIVMGFANPPAAAGGEIAPGAVAREVLARRRIFGGHLRPVALQFLGDELRQAGQRALAHFGARDADDHGVVGPDDDPGIDLRRGALRQGFAEGNVEAEAEAAERGGGADDEAAAGNGGGCDVQCGHGSPSPYVRRPLLPPAALPAASWIAVRMRL